jgi:hypothetical protein
MIRGRTVPLSIHPSLLRHNSILICFRLEAVIREAVAAGDHDRVEKIVQQLCHDYAYAVHQPHARNGGLIGLAAAAIALGPVYMIRQYQSDWLIGYRKSLNTSKKLFLPC